ncbi:hypothetical protein ABEB36_004955 [Hypothenemus hampei]|uniref:Uncharacterized protein n=1 Tax=Hypothenemus hampei TaxID=57062 RepID=A0ABD1EZH4_HYPHA
MKYSQMVSMPSEVSDWLEEQLEARGIDSKVYARYILSLLHAHELEVIRPEEDFPFTKLKKEEKRCQKQKKPWFKQSLDADQIKRSAAVECLMSAADQVSCEIESLVDELCKKLKEINSETTESPNSQPSKEIKIVKGPHKEKNISPQELAKKYYAAFPPLGKTEDSSNFSSNNSISNTWPSGKVSQPPTISSLVKKSRKRTKRMNMNSERPEIMKPVNENRLTQKWGNYSTESIDNFANRETVKNLFLAQTWNSFGGKIALTPLDEELRDCPLTQDVYIPNYWPDQKNIETTIKRRRLIKEENKYYPLYPNPLWSNTSYADDPLEEEEEEETAIKEEYNRPPANNVTQKFDYLEPMTPKNEQYCNDNNKNEELFSIWQAPNMISDFLQLQDDEFMKQNDFNNFLESHRLRTCHTDRLDEDNEKFQGIFNNNTINIEEVEDNTVRSAFCVYKRPSIQEQTLIQCSSKINSYSLPSYLQRKRPSTPDMYFQPLEVLLIRDELKQMKAKEKNNGSSDFNDGTTFKIESSLDEIKYQRSVSGSLLLETEFGEINKYFEYDYRPSSEDDVMSLSGAGISNENERFKVKYSVSSNDKSCQTEEGDLLESSGNTLKMIESSFSCNSSLLPEATIPLNNQDEMFDLVWSYEPQASKGFCRDCNLKNTWPVELSMEWSVKIKDIWGCPSVESCDACPWGGTKAATPLEETTMKLRKESQEEAEQLLSDLSSLQLSNSERLLETYHDTKHGNNYLNNNESDIWCFTARLREDCSLINWSTLPARHSVTL